MNWLSARTLFNTNHDCKKKFLIGPIGMEFAIEQLHMVQLQSDQDNNIFVRSWASIDYPCPRNQLLSRIKLLKKLLQQALRKHDFQNRQVVSVLPYADQKILSITYQLDANQKDSDVIIKLLSNRLKGDLAEYVLDFIPVRSAINAQQRHAVVAAAPQQKVLGYLEALRKSGLEVTALEIGPAAIKRLVSSLSEPMEGVSVLVVNFGVDVSYLTMISGRRLLFDEQVNFGEKHILEKISHVLDLPIATIKTLMQKKESIKVGSNAHHDDSVSCQNDLHSELNLEVHNTLLDLLTTLLRPVVNDIQRALRYGASQTHGEPAKHIFILGSIARWTNADTILSQLLHLPVKLIPDPLLPFYPTVSDVKFNGSHGLPEIAVATGLALRGMQNNA